jgi:hypothetical protein
MRRGREAGVECQQKIKSGSESQFVSQTGAGNEIAARRGAETECHGPCPVPNYPRPRSRRPSG